MAWPLPAHAAWQDLRAVDGLPGDEVFAIAQGRDGTIAFGTDQGVGIFDGDRWTTYTTPLPNLAVKALLQDRHGVWWFGTEHGGLARFDGVTWSVIGVASGQLPNDQIEALLEDRVGDLWVGTSGGLARHRAATGAWETIPAAQLVNPQVNDLLEDRRGRLWVATPEGASMTDASRTQWTSYRKDPLALAQDSLFSVGEDRDGGVWFGSYSGATRLDPSGTWRTYPVGSGIPGGDLNAIVRDSTGGLWFAGGSGIARFDGRSFQPYTGTPSGVVFGPVLSLLVDDPGNLWVGTFFRGAHRSDGAAFDDFIATGGPCEILAPTGAPVHNREIASNCLNDLLEDHRGERWVATAESGVARLDAAGDWSAMRAAPGGLASDSASALFEDRAGNLWIGTSTAGLSRVDSTRTNWTRFTHADGLVADSVSTLFEDAAGVLWVGTPRGVSRRLGNGWTPLLQSGFAGVPNPCLVMQCVEDGSHTVWIRAVQGLWSVDPSRTQVQRRGTADGLPDDEVGAILRARDGTIWAGTPNGLAHLVDGAWQRWNAADVPIGAVQSLYEDHADRIWASGPDGVAVYDGGGWTAYSNAVIGFGPVVQVLQDLHGRMWFGALGSLGYWNGTSWRHVDRLGGLASVDVARMMEDSQGRLWLIGQGGLTLVAPDRTGPQTVFRLPPVSITTSRSLSFAFGAAYNETADLEFLPSWDGVPEPTWSAATDFSRSDVPDGIHTFSVRARDWARNEDPSPATVTFEVDATPPQAVLSAPRFGAPVRGVVSIEGSTADARYLSHRVEFRPLGGPSWTTLAASSRAVSQDTLAAWDTGSLADGDYELRLSVQDSLGLVGTALVRVIVDNVAPFVDVTSPVLVRASAGGDVFTTDSDVHLYLPPLALDADATVRIERDSTGTVPARLPDGAQPVAAAWRLDWAGAKMKHPGVLDMRAPAGETRPLAIYAELTTGAWQHLGGSPTSPGAPLSVPVSAPGRYALFTGGTPASTTGLGAIALAPRAFSPHGTFGSREVAIGFSLGRPASVDVTVFNRAGRMVRQVASGLSLPGGAGVVHWDGKDRDGRVVEEGLYIVTVEALGERQTQTLAVLR